MATEPNKDEKAVAVAEQNVKSSELAFRPTQENIELLKKTLAGQSVNLTDNELQLVLYQANKTGLDPLARQIYALKTGGRLSLMTSIDGQRLVAQRTGEYQGQVGPQWCGKDGKWVDVWLEDGDPLAARVGVMRKGFTEPLYGVARWKSYANTNSQTWKKMGDVMLAKCAEALALRKAFPQELSGLYTQEEMDQADAPAREVIEAEPVDAAAKPKTIQDMLGEIGKLLEQAGIKDPEDRRTVVKNIGDVSSINALKHAKVVEILEFVTTADKATLETFLPAREEPIDGEIVDRDAEDIPS